MRLALALLSAVLMALPVGALAADRLTPAAVQSTFGTGVAFTAANVGGKTYAMVLRQDGTASRTPMGSNMPEKGTWRAAGIGYCSKWGNATAEQCYSIEQFTTTIYRVFAMGDKLVAFWTT